MAMVPPWEPNPTEVMVRVSPVSGAMVSLARTSSELSTLFSTTVKASAVAMGGSFTGFTVTVTVAVASLPGVPSLMV